MRRMYFLNFFNLLFHYYNSNPPCHLIVAVYYNNIEMTLDRPQPEGITPLQGDYNISYPRIELKALYASSGIILCFTTKSIYVKISDKLRTAHFDIIFKFELLDIRHQKSELCLLVVEVIGRSLFSHFSSPSDIYHIKTYLLSIK